MPASALALTIITPAGTKSQKARHAVAMFDILGRNRDVDSAYRRLPVLTALATKLSELDEKPPRRGACMKAAETSYTIDDQAKIVAEGVAGLDDELRAVYDSVVARAEDHEQGTGHTRDEQWSRSMRFKLSKMRRLIRKDKLGASPTLSPQPSTSSMARPPRHPRPVALREHFPAPKGSP